MPNSLNDQLISTSTRLYSKRVSLTATAVALGDATQDLTELRLQAHPDNAANVEVGSPSDQSWVLVPGQELNCPIRNPSLVWGRAPSGSGIVNLLGRSGV